MPRPASPSESSSIAGPNAGERPTFPQIPGYRFQKRLGEGGMATVFLATQESLDRSVAIKVMEREGLQDEVSKQRFENEARTIAQISHPCIVAIYEVGRTSDGRMYYIMPLLANGDVSQRDLRNNEGAIIRVLRALLSALDYAHQRGIVHRDVKSANVLYDVADRPLLTDFGIALSKRDTSRITMAGLAVGSSGYMAPEQARGGDVDGRADLYSVGVLAYELLTGRLPYQAPDALALALMHAQNPIPRLPTKKRHWQFFVDKAMAKSPDQRYRDAPQMMDAIDRIERRSEEGFIGRSVRGPGTVALLGALLVAVGLYAVRDRLPWPKSGAAHTTGVAQALAPTAEAASIASHAASGESQASLAHSNDGATPPETEPAVGAHVPQANPVGIPAAAAVTASPSSTTASLSPDAAIFAEARDAIAHGNITSPADDNAMDLTRMAWKLSPNADDARTLATDTLKALAEQQAQAIVQHHDPRVLDYQLKRQQLADATIGRDAPVARVMQATLASAVDRRVAAESSISDDHALKRTEALARQIDLADVYSHALAAAQKAKSATTAAVALTADAGFVLLPSASPKTPPAELARTEVTRHEYAQFVNATRRPAAACKGANPEPASGRKSWSEPGFAVTSEQPVVCVSWGDANAYAAWLGAQKGLHYRLASSTDWQTAKGQDGIAGAHAEWLQNCATGCQNHLLAGHGADGSSGRDATQGFDDVGFRVVRVLDAHH